MTKFTTTAKNAGSVAARVLFEWTTGPKKGLGNQLAQARELASQLPPPSTLETERIEVLVGAIEFLESHKPERVEAALCVLAQLANAQSAKSVNRRVRRPFASQCSQPARSSSALR